MHDTRQGSCFGDIINNAEVPGAGAKGSFSHGFPEALLFVEGACDSKILCFNDYGHGCFLFFPSNSKSCS